MFGKLGFIIQRDLIATLRRPFYLIFAIGAPLIMAIVAGVIYQINSQPGGGELSREGASQEVVVEEKPVGIVDRAGLFTTDVVIPLAGFVKFSDEPAAKTNLFDQQISGYYVIPADYLSGGKVDYYTEDANPINIDTDASRLQQLLLTGLFAGRPDMVTKIMAPFELQVNQLSEAPEPEDYVNNWFAGRLSMFMVILLYMVILVPASTLVSSLTDEKKNQVMEVLLCSVSPLQLFVGKLLAAGLLGLLQTLLWVGVLWAVGNLGGQPLGLPSGYQVPTNLLLWGVIYAILGYLMYGAQLGGVGAIAPNLGESRSVTMLIMLPLIIGYTLTTVTTEDPNSFLSYVLSFFPLTAPVAMIGRLAAVDLPLWEPILSTVLQIIAVVGLVYLFSRLFHARLMLSGQPLTVRRLLKELTTRN